MGHLTNLEEVREAIYEGRNKLLFRTAWCMVLMGGATFDPAVVDKVLGHVKKDIPEWLLKISTALTYGFVYDNIRWFYDDAHPEAVELTKYLYSCGGANLDSISLERGRPMVFNFKNAPGSTTNLTSLFVTKEGVLNLPHTSFGGSYHCGYQFKYDLVRKKIFVEPSTTMYYSVGRRACEKAMLYIALVMGKPDFFNHCIDNFEHELEHKVVT